MSGLEACSNYQEEKSNLYRNIFYVGFQLYSYHDVSSIFTDYPSIYSKGLKIFGTTPLSILLVAILIALFIWKVIFYLIELRVVLRENFLGIILSSLIIAVFFILYYLLVAITLGYKIPDIIGDFK